MIMYAYNKAYFLLKKQSVFQSLRISNSIFQKFMLLIQKQLKAGGSEGTLLREGGTMYGKK